MFDQGEPVERAHVLLSGAIRIAQAGSDGGQVVLRFIGPGEIFGSVAIFTDHLYPADGIAMVGSTEASWTRADWLGLIGRRSEERRVGKGCGSTCRFRGWPYP